MCFVSYPLENWLILTQDVKGNSVLHFLVVFSFARERIKNEIKKIFVWKLTVKLEAFSVLQTHVHQL